MDQFNLKILAIGAHFDDVELGCGGSLLKWKKEGNEIFIYVATKSGYSDANGIIIRSNEIAKQEGELVASYIGAELFTSEFSTFSLESKEPLHKKLLELLEKIKPDLVLVHGSSDSHRDHSELSKAAVHVFSRKVKKILFYRSNWYLSATNFDRRFFTNIDDFLEEKILIIKKYDSEFKRTYGIWEDWLRSEAIQCGLIAGCRYSEGFEVIKYIE